MRVIKSKVKKYTVQDLGGRTFEIVADKCEIHEDNTCIFYLKGSVVEFFSKDYCITRISAKCE